MDTNIFHRLYKKKAGVIVIQDSALGNDETASLIKEIPSDITIVKAQNTRLALAVMSANYFGNPAKSFYNWDYRNKRQDNNNIYGQRMFLTRRN